MFTSAFSFFYLLTHFYSTLIVSRSLCYLVQIVSGAVRVVVKNSASCDAEQREEAAALAGDGHRHHAHAHAAAAPDELDLSRASRRPSEVVYAVDLKAGSSFGELALQSAGGVRSGTVVAAAPTLMLTLDRVTYAAVLGAVHQDVELDVARLLFRVQVRPPLAVY